MPLAADLSWTSRQDVETDGQQVSTRTEVTTVYANLGGNWFTATRSIDTPTAAGAAAPTASFGNLIDGHGCMVDTLIQQSLQDSPCPTAVAAGDAWTIQRPNGRERRELKAVGREAVSVPAGNFQALRVEEVDYAQMVVAGGARAMRPTLRMIY